MSLPESFEENIPKYKLCTANSVSKADAKLYFSNFIAEETLYKNKEAYECIEGSLLIFHPSGIENFIFLEIHCKIIAKPGTGSVSCKSVMKFMKFCVRQQTDIKIPRNKCIMPASEGALMSDLWNSQAFKKARHYAEYKYRANKKYKQSNDN